MIPDIDLAFALFDELISRITFGHLCNMVGLVVACYTLYVNVQLRNTIQRMEIEMTSTRPAERQTDIRISIESLTTLREIADSVRVMQGRPPRARKEAGREPPRAREVEAGGHEAGRVSAEGSIVTSESTREEKAARAVQNLTRQQWGEFEPEEVDW